MDDPVIEVERDGYTISTDRGRLDLAAAHRFLSASYRAPGFCASACTDRRRRSCDW